MTTRKRIDPTAMLIGDVMIDSGSYIGPFCVLGFPQDEKVLNSVAIGARVGRRARSGVRIKEKCCLLSHVVIGERTVLGAEVWCDHHTYIGCYTTVGDGVEIMYGARIYNRVKIGQRAWVAGFVCNDSIIERDAIVLGQLIHRFVDAVEGVPEPAPVIREGAFVGMNSTIIGGIEIGVRAYIAAGAVLTRDALPGRLYAGIPARNIGRAPEPFRLRAKTK